MIDSARIGILVLLLGVSGSDGARTAGTSSALKMVEGTIVDVGSLPGEGGLELVTVRLANAPGDAAQIELLLAPRAALEETGFTVTEGDQLKAQIFTTDEGPARVHKVRNLSQGSMVRLRTLHQIPLWDGAGRWQGGYGMGGAGRHQGPQHGQQPRGGGPPPR